MKPGRLPWLEPIMGANFLLTLKKESMSNNDIIPGFDTEACDFLTIRLDKVEGVDDSLVLRLKGQVDTYSSNFFQRSVKKVIDAGFVRLILVLNGVDYVSSKAVGAFVQIKKTATDNGGEIAIVEVHPKVMEIFKNLSLDKFLCCMDSLDEAIAQINNDKKAAQFSEAAECPICERKLRVQKAGQFRCPECMAVLTADETGMVRLGSP
jgi:anti-anti-sigma factor